MVDGNHLFKYAQLTDTVDHQLIDFLLSLDDFYFS